jgi:hypothetical protein
MEAEEASAGIVTKMSVWLVISKVAKRMPAAPAARGARNLARMISVSLSKGCATSYLNSAKRRQLGESGVAWTNIS